MINFVLYHIPSSTGLISAIFFYIGVGLYGMSLGGHQKLVMKTISSYTGLFIENIKVSGNIETSESDVLQLLSLNELTSILEFDVAVARQKLSMLPWIKDIEVRKVYPNTIEIRIAERTASAIWQYDSNLSLIDKTGKLIVPLTDKRFMNLPVLVGRDAEKTISSFDKQFIIWPAIKERIKAYVWVASRRWDLYLYNGIIIKLPEDGVDLALLRLLEMEKKYNILERDISVVDLRLSDRMTVRLTPDALVRRQAVIDERKRIKNKGYHGT
ncbi:Cell division protein FtsQ [Liberibacter crescens BT-1]|uniref:Cell division protein FtsQ n=1 Tax=Liberibacter crescens (strain BT-1) TaxID=1215343 RepID=L0EUF6_LIBCB|nr:cell division protein FtsQ/DivIB [Liberibacter crescens]AGA64587.1 Cell division protein FtsQ [Liberibacter crescens BT-1]